MAFYKILTVKVNNIYNTPNDLYTIPSKLQYQYDMICLMSGHHYIRLQAKPIWKHRTNYKGMWQIIIMVSIQKKNG